jgi:hypothetical protein
MAERMKNQLTHVKVSRSKAERGSKYLSRIPVSDKDESLVHFSIYDVG